MNSFTAIFHYHTPPYSPHLLIQAPRSNFEEHSSCSQHLWEILKLEPKTLTTAYLLATAEVIKFNLPFFPGKRLQNAFIEDWPQCFLYFKLLVECDGSLCFLIALFLAFFDKNN